MKGGKLQNIIGVEQCMILKNLRMLFQVMGKYMILKKTLKDLKTIFYDKYFKFLVPLEHANFLLLMFLPRAIPPPPPSGYLVVEGEEPMILTSILSLNIECDCAVIIFILLYYKYCYI